MFKYFTPRNIARETILWRGGPVSEGITRGLGLSSLDFDFQKISSILFINCTLT